MANVGCENGSCAITEALGYRVYTCIRWNVTGVCNTSHTTCCETFMCNSDGIGTNWTGEWPSSSHQAPHETSCCVFVLFLGALLVRLLEDG